MIIAISALMTSVRPAFAETFVCGTADHTHPHKSGDIILNGSCGTDPGGDWTIYGNLNTYIPRGGASPIQNAPIKTIAVNFNVMQRSDGSSNFQNTSTDRNRLKQILSWVNQFYSSGTPSDPVGGVVELPNHDSKIRFTLGAAGQERIFFYQDDNLWGQGSNTSLLQNAVETADPGRMRYLNIFWTGGFYQGKVINQNIIITNGGSGYTSPPTVTFSPGAVTASGSAQIQNGQVIAITIDNNGDDGGSYHGITPPTITISGGGGSGATAIVTQLAGGAGAYASFPSQSNLSLKQHVVMLKTDGSGGPNSDWGRAGTLAHELGHILDLLHTYPGGGGGANCNNNDEYLSDIFGPHPGTCEHIANWNADAWDTGIPNHEKITNNVVGGNNDIRYESPMQAGQMHRSLAVSSLRRHVLESYSGIPLAITGNETWDFDIKLYRDIDVQPGATLTLACRVVMPAQGKIFVRPGGRLIIDGGTVTAEANWSSMWQGIRLSSGGNASQHPIANSPQAVLEMKNGALIENAIIGVVSYSGGVIQAENSSFRNNQNGVEFYWYTNSIPSGPSAGTPLPNLSYFNGCTFETTALLNNQSLVPQRLAYLAGVDGIMFRGCTFRNTATGDYHLNFRGHGIVGEDASFSVLRLCNPGSPIGQTGCSDYQASRFDNLRYAIHAISAGELRSIKVDKAEFSGNWRSIYLKSVDRFTVTANNFDVGPLNNWHTESSSPHAYGLYAHSSTGFTIQENYFTTSDDGQYGVIFHQTGSAANELFNNSFESINSASHAQNHNNGLQIKCNSYINNIATDISVAAPFGSIAYFQGACGSNSSPAGNTFNNDCDPGWSWKEIWKSIGLQGINYSHHPNPGGAVYTKPICTAPGVYLNNCQSSSYSAASCQSRLSPLTMATKKAERQRLNDEIIDTGGVIDDGETDGLIQQIQDAVTPAPDVLISLNAASPYLSDQVLLALVNDGPAKLTHTDIALLLITNSRLTDAVYQALLGMDPPMPPALMEQIDEVQTGMSERAQIDAQIAELERERAFITNEIWREYLQREDYDLAIPEMITYQEELYAGSQLLEASTLRMMIETQLHSGQSARAQEILDDYCSAGAEADYCTLINLLINLKQEGRTILQLNPAEETTVRTIAGSSSYSNLVKARAQALLSIFGDDDWQEEIHGLGAARGGAAQNSEPTAGENDKPGTVAMKVYPNPAASFARVEFKLDSDYEQVYLNVYTSLGLRIGQFPVTDASTQLVLPTGDWTNGVYHLSLNADGRALSWHQLTIVE